MDIKNSEVNLENEYRKFLKSEPNLGSDTVGRYVRILRNKTLSKLSYFNEIENNEIYDISDIDIYKDVVKKIKKSANYKDINSLENGTLNTSLNYYEKFLTERESQSSTQNSDESNKNDTHRKHIDKPHQRIFFGAPRNWEELFAQ